MPDRPSFYLFGESHVHTFSHWWNQGASASSDIYFDLSISPIPEFKEITTSDAHGATILNPIIQNALVEFGIYPFRDYLNQKKNKNAFIFLIIGSSICYQHLFEIGQEQIDFAAPGMHSMNASFEGKLIPYDLIDRSIDARMASLSQGIRLLAEELGDRLIVLSPPPPHRHNDAAEAYLAKASPVGQKYEIPRPSVRLKLQKLYHEKMREICQAENAVYLDTWPETSADDGFLLDEFEFDGFHCRPSYAGRVFELLEAQLHLSETIKQNKGLLGRLFS